MKILCKCLGKMCFMGFVMLMSYFLCQFSISAVVSVRKFDLRDEFYEFNKNGIGLYLVSIMMILGILLYITYISQRIIHNKIILFIFTIVGVGILIFTVDRWIDWLDVLFSKYQLYDYNEIEIGFENTYGNKMKAKNTIKTVIVSFFIFYMLFGNMDILLDGRVYIKEAFMNKNNLKDNSILGLVGYLFWPVLSIVNIAKLSNLFIVIIMFFVLILYFVSNIVIWRRMISYMKLENEESVCIVVSEIGEGNFIYELFKKEYKFIRQLYREGIILIPKKEYQIFHKERKNDISLECYTAFYVKENEIQKNHLKNAAFHMAFFEYLGNKEKLKSFYDVIIEENSVGKVIQDIVPYCYKISYRKNLEDKLHNNSCTEREKKNLFVNNYTEIVGYLYNEIDNFQSFKILLNTIEMLNYFYTLILISFQEWDVSSLIQRQSNILANATFGSWILVRNKFLFGKKQMNKILNNSYNYNKCKCFKIMMEGELCDYKLFIRLFQMIDIEGQYLVNIHNKFELFSSFDIMKIFRDYTRGHGVYTFKISDELNLSLMEIVKLWFFELDKNGFLEDDYCNLEQLGWIYEYKNMTYFFYSYKKDTNELEYHCFLDGSVLFLPNDIIE